MSKLRTTYSNDSGEKFPCPDRFDALYMIRDSVERRPGLLYGKLNDGNGHYCAIGAFWHDNPKLALPGGLVDEVAAYNDSIPKSASMYVRRNKVLRWLTKKLAYLSPPKAKSTPFKKRKLAT